MPRQMHLIFIYLSFSSLLPRHEQKELIEAFVFLHCYVNITSHTRNALLCKRPVNHTITQSAGDSPTDSTSVYTSIQSVGWSMFSRGTYAELIRPGPAWLPAASFELPTIKFQPHESMTFLFGVIPSYSVFSPVIGAKLVQVKV